MNSGAGTKKSHQPNELCESNESFESNKSSKHNELFEYDDLPGFKWNATRVKDFENEITQTDFNSSRNQIVKLINEYPGTFQYIGRYNPNTNETSYLATTSLLPSLLGITTTKLLTIDPQKIRKKVYKLLKTCIPDDHYKEFKKQIEKRRNQTLTETDTLEAFYFLLDNNSLKNVSQIHKGTYIIAFSEICLPKAYSPRKSEKNAFLLCGLARLPISQEDYNTLQSIPLSQLPENKTFKKNLKTPSNKLQTTQKVGKTADIFDLSTPIVINPARLQALNTYQTHLAEDLNKKQIGLIDIKFLSDEIKSSEAMVQEKARELIKKIHKATVKEDTEVYFHDKHEGSNTWLMVSWYPAEPQTNSVKETENSTPTNKQNTPKSQIKKNNARSVNRSLGNVTKLITQIKLEFKKPMISTFIEKMKDKNSKLQKKVTESHTKTNKDFYKRINI